MSTTIEAEINPNDGGSLSIWDKLANWSEKVSDYGNAIVVKETRQALKSKQFVITFLLMLIASWGISFFGVMVNGTHIQYGETANGFFMSFFGVLTIAVLVIVPFTAFRSLLQERDLFTYDLLSITALKPRQIIVGKLLSALMQTLIYFSAIAPFIAFTSFLGGFDFATTIFLLLFALVLSVFYCTVALMIAAFAKKRIFQALLTIPILFGLVFQEFFLMMGMVPIMMFEIPMGFADEGFWWIVGFGLLFFCSYIVLFLQIAITQLTFASGNRSTPIRITCFVQFLLYWGSLFGFLFYIVTIMGRSSMRDDDVVAFTIFPAIHLAIIGLFSASESNFLSRRIRRDMPKTALKRFVSVPFMPGGSRGYLYVVLQVFMLSFLSMILWLIFGESGATSGDNVSLFILMICSYLVIFFSFVSALSRWGEKLSGDIRPGHIRALAVFAIAGSSLIPILVRFFYQIVLKERGGMSYIFMDGLNPFWTLATVLDNGTSRGMMSIVCILVPIAAGIGLIINIAPTLTGINEILFNDFKSASYRKNKKQ